MSKPTGISHSTLSWVKKELDDTLRQAAEALETYSQDPSDPTHLQFCGSHLHQVHGILQMLELFGAAMLVEEMEQVVDALLRDRVQQAADAQQTLMQAILQLGDYLERVESGLQDIPILLLPLLNDLRAARGANLLTEHSLFAPDLDAAQVRLGRPRFTGEALQDVARRQRSRYQRGLLGLLREQNVDASLTYMLDALSQLEAAATDDGAGNIWWIAGGLVEALQHRSVEAAAAVKMLLGQVDRQIRRAIEGGEAAFSADPPRELIKNLLYYVARADTRGERVPAIQAAYGLKDLLLDERQLDAARKGMSGPNADILQTVASALKDDLTAAKDSLDLYARSGYDDRERLVPLVDGLHRVADTLGVIGLGVSRRLVKQQVERIQGLADDTLLADESVLMEIAEALLYVESAIDDLSGGAASAQPEQDAEVPEGDPQPSLPRLSDSEYQQVYGTAVGEAVADVGRIKESIVKFVESGGQADIAELDQHFAELAGALRLLEKAHVADLLQGAARYIAANFAVGGLPAEADLDALADAIASVEYYLEAARDGRAHPESVLEVAVTALGKLGFAPSQQGDPACPPVATTGYASPADVVGGEAEPPVELGEPDIVGIGLDSGSVFGEAADAAPAAAPETTAQTPPADGMAEAAKRTGRINYSVPVMADAVDEDILEIFIEEAGEVLETLHEQYPRWRDDPEDTEALTTVRRMYHTLKGSGRLAGALQLGELAWSIESLLNRVLERKIPADQDVHAVVQESMQALPALIGQIQGHPAPETDVFAIMRRAETLADPERASGPAAQAAVPPADAIEPAVPATGAGQEPAGDLDAAGDESADLWPAPPVDEGSDFPVLEELVLEGFGIELELPDPDQADSEAADLQLDWDQPSQWQEQLPEPWPAAEPADERGPVDGAGGPAPQPAADPPQPAMDPVLYDIFSRETADHLAVVSAFIERGREAGDHAQSNEALVRALHTLTGSARMADVEPIARVGRKLEVFAERHSVAERPVAGPGLDLLERGAGLIQQMVACLPSPEPQWPDIAPFLRDLDAATAALDDVAPALPEAGFPAEVAHPEPDQEAIASAESDDRLHQPDVAPDLVALFLEEAEDILGFMETTVQRWEDEPDHAGTIAELHRSLHTLKGGARLAGFGGMAILCHALESVSTDVAAHRVPADDVFFNLLHTCLDRLAALLERAKQGGSPDAPSDLLQAIADLRGSSTPASVGAAADHVDSELVDVFLEEASDILEATETALNRWQAEPANGALITELQRALHTLKGGARMAGFPPIADLSHGFETLLVGVQSGSPAPSAGLFDVLEQVYDRLLTLREEAANGERLEQADDLLAALEALRTGSAPRREVADAAPAQPGSEAQSAPAAGERTPPEVAAPPLEADPAPVRNDLAAHSDVVRVRADLLDNLVNFAGEVSIYRARLEQQVGAVRFNLGELDQTVARLREQLRTLEIETEAQILYRFEREYEGAASGRDDFDPLELDRFSRMQELSRALSESTNDLVSIQGLLENLVRESETLLLQQSRVNTELQDGLMRTRMVPFANLVPRMRRIVRQTCQELGKQAQLKVIGAQGEMDRTVLERVTAPLEHMLRNAIAHGVEDPDVRRQAGKPAEGTITVALSREGADVVIQVSDDGGGIKLEAIRRRAIAMGLMPADAPLSDRELMQFILESGFSTMETVTQIAGRGVGMDVVASEIKQLGGTLDIDSNADAGTTFTVRLPFTLAVNQALLCQVGEEVYAIPLTSIEGVVRMTHEELEQCFSHPQAAYYDYAGERYDVRSLSGLLGGDSQLPGSGRRVPIILVQTGDHRVAIQVDALLGNREIVVKSVGAQISTVPGIYGATILADGRVVLILDVSSLVRLAMTVQVAAEPTMQRLVDRARKTTIMVVDDSITMRKVAARLLERNGMAVITAKDGVDAVARLQEHVPDAMLLDIEMPRMDGYELAIHMRNDPRLKQVPIIIITSRTGEKHRQRALEIGVNRYLGKPYQEADLLDSLREVLEESHVHG